MVLICKMNIIKYFVFLVILICGPVLNEKMGDDVPTEKYTPYNQGIINGTTETTTNVDLSSDNSEHSTEFTTVANNSEESEALTDAKDDTYNNSTTLQTDEADDSQFLSDFDDLEYVRKASDIEDDFVDDDGFARELHTEDSSKELNSFSAAMAPAINAALGTRDIHSRDGAKGKEKTFRTANNFHSSSNENSVPNRELNIQRRMFDAGSINHGNRFAPDPPQFEKASNPFHLFSPNFGHIPSQPYSSTPFPPAVNILHIPFQRFPVEQNINPYKYITRPPKSEYPNSYQTPNSYPFLGHSEDLRPFTSYNEYRRLVQEFYKRMVPDILNRHNSLYSNTHNYMTPTFINGRFA